MCIRDRRKYGYGDVAVTTVLHQWMGGFPADEAKAFGVISTGSLIAAFSKATKVIVKSPHEAVGIPTMEANAQGPVSYTHLAFEKRRGKKIAIHSIILYNVAKLI